MARYVGNNSRNIYDGTSNNDQIYGLGGNDILYGWFGNDYINGGAGADNIYGEGGNDRMFGESGDDYLSGGEGNDLMNGGNGNDSLNGGNGRDILGGGVGNDEVRGGAGTDRFNFIVNSFSAAGLDTFYDFDETTEYINLGSYGDFSLLDTNLDGNLTTADVWVWQSGRETVIDVGAAFGFASGNEVLTVYNSSTSPLDSNDFLFA